MANKANNGRLFSHDEFEEALKRDLAGFQLTKDNAPLDINGLARELSSVLGHASSQDNHLKNVEMSIEQNYNQIDGVINNLPQPEPGEAGSEARLLDRLDKNLSDYHTQMMSYEKSEIIDMAGTIAAMGDVHFFLRNHYDFDQEQVAYLLRFANPLEMVCDEWQRRNEDISDIDFAVDDVFSRQETHGRYPHYVEAENNGTYLQKFSDVNILKTLKAIADQKIVHYPNDINVDMELIPKLFAGGDHEKRMLLWHVSGYGTHINPERDTFVIGTGAHNTWVEYLRPGMLSYAVEITGMDAGIVKGNVYELNHEAHVAHVRNVALPAATVSITYDDGRVHTVSRREFDDDRNLLMSESGNVKRVRFHPRSEKGLLALIDQEQMQRVQAPEGNFRDHIKTIVDCRIQSEADRICAEMKGLTEPNSPTRTHFMVRLSNEFMVLASSKEQTRLLDALPYKTKMLTQFLDEKGIFLTVKKDEIQKPSVLKQLADLKKQVGIPKKITPNQSVKKDGGHPRKFCVKAVSGKERNTAKMWFCPRQSKDPINPWRQVSRRVARVCAAKL